MDSLSKLNIGCSRIDNTEQWDDDTRKDLMYSEIKNWCNTFLSLDKNILETSISASHARERRKEAVKKILNL